MVMLDLESGLTNGQHKLGCSLLIQSWYVSRHDVVGPSEINVVFFEKAREPVLGCESKGDARVTCCCSAVLMVLACTDSETAVVKPDVSAASFTESFSSTSSVTCRSTASFSCSSLPRKASTCKSCGRTARMTGGEGCLLSPGASNMTCKPVQKSPSFVSINLGQVCHLVS